MAPSLRSMALSLCALGGAAASGIPDARQDFFFVGGEYVDITSGNTTNTYMVNQIYVEKLTPKNVTQELPLVMIHGAGQTATNWYDTPDGRPGWASYFLDQGYTIYLSDQPQRGRSAWNPFTDSIMITFSVSDMESLFTNTEAYDDWPQAKLHTQWPGAGVAGDPIFDQFMASQVQYDPDRRSTEEMATKAYSALLDKIGPAYLITHSQSGPYGWRIADARPNLVKAIASMEPAGPPFEQQFPHSDPVRPWGPTDGPITYSPPAGVNASNLETETVPAPNSNYSDCVRQTEPAKQFANLLDIPVMILTGEASYHAPYDYCTVEVLRQGGVDVEYAELGKEGIKGNGHFMFIELNNLVIAERVRGFLAEH